MKIVDIGLLFFYMVASGTMIYMTILSSRTDRAYKKQREHFQKQFDEAHRLEIEFKKSAIRKLNDQEDWQGGL